jgi:hypothetical protein
MFDDSPEGFMLAKAHRVIKRRALPHSRAELRAAYADINRRLNLGEQPLGAFGKSILGYATYFESHGASEDEAKLLAHSLLEVMCLDHSY